MHYSEEAIDRAHCDIITDKVDRFITEMKTELLPILELMDDGESCDDLARALQLALNAADKANPHPLSVEMARLIRKAVKAHVPKPDYGDVIDFLDDEREGARIDAAVAEWKGL